MEEYGFIREQIMSELYANRHSHVTTTYYLLLKNKVRKGGSSIADLISQEFIDYINNSENFLSNYNNDISVVIKKRTAIKIDILANETISDFESKKIDTITSLNTQPSRMNTIGNDEKKTPVKKNYKRLETSKKSNTNNNSLNYSNLNTETGEASNESNIPSNTLKNKTIYKKIPATINSNDYLSDHIKNKMSNRRNEKNLINTSMSFDKNVDSKNMTYDNIKKKSVSPRKNK